eukprot:1110760-Rhodomonas_salina.2
MQPISLPHTARLQNKASLQLTDIATHNQTRAENTSAGGASTQAVSLGDRAEDVTAYGERERGFAVPEIVEDCRVLAFRLDRHRPRRLAGETKAEPSSPRALAHARVAFAAACPG